MNTWTWISGSDYLCHYGTPTHSGRYPWGSGNRPHQRLEKSKRSLPKKVVNTGKKAVNLVNQARESSRKSKVNKIIRRSRYREIRRNVGMFTDDELREALNRANMLVSLKNAGRSNEQKTRSEQVVDYGKKLVNDVLENVGKNVIVPAATGYVAYKVKNFIADRDDDIKDKDRPKFYDELTRGINKKANK